MADCITNNTLVEALKKTSTTTKDYVDSNFQKSTDENLLTENKTIVGAINEILEMIPDDVMTEKQVYNADTHYDFPSIGSVNVIYKAYTERKTYQWNEEKMIYETLDEDDINADVSDITLIDGGNADGTT